MGQPELGSLFEYGILNEQSDIRAHVAAATRTVYVFRTAFALDAIKSHEYPRKMAYQEGVTGPTAVGYIVPWKDIADIRRIDLAHCDWWNRFPPEGSGTTELGNAAVGVVCWMLRNAHFPLWTHVAADSQRLEVQKNGTDILLWGKWRIQVKCDRRAGEGGTGNLFFQIAERNPHKRF